MLWPPFDPDGFDDPNWLEPTPIIDSILDESKKTDKVCLSGGDVGSWCDLCLIRLDCEKVKIPCYRCKHPINRYDEECWRCGEPMRRK